MHARAALVLVLVMTGVVSRAAADEVANVHVLERDALVLGGVRLLGATLWTDYALQGDAEAAMHAAGRLLADHHMIRNGDRPWTPWHARAEHHSSRAWLAEQLAVKHPGPTVVVTHHAPSRQSVSPRFKFDAVTPAFVSDLGDLVGQADVWVHGHTHAGFDYTIGGCRVVMDVEEGGLVTIEALERLREVN